MTPVSRYYSQTIYPDDALIIGYSALSNEHIETGIHNLAEIIKRAEKI